MTSPTAPTAPPGTTPGQYTLTDLMNLFHQLAPLSSTTGSDDLNKAWLAAQAQMNSAMLSQATQLAGQDQTNQLRMIELMGAQPGATPGAAATPTDAAVRWRQELQAQQDIQNTRLQQEYAQLMGYGLNPDGTINTDQQTLGGRQQTLAEQTQQAQQAQALAQLTGYTAQGQSTLGEQQLQNEMQQAAQNRQQQLQMQTMQQTHQAALQALSQNWQTQEAINARAGQMALQQGQQQWQSGESAAQRALQLQLQGGQEQWQSGENLAQRQLQQTLQSQQEQWQSGESAQERNLKLQLQSGQLNQQESEFARNYLLQQQQARLQAAQASGYMDNGQLTEAARAARSQETTQRAQLAAQLLSSPKDVFRAGAYFRALGGGANNPAAMGLGGGGIAGFNSLSDRLGGGGLPGTVSPNDLLGMLGGNVGASAQAPGAADVLGQGASTSPLAAAATATGTPAALPTTGSTTRAQTEATTNLGAAQANPLDALKGLGGSTDTSGTALQEQQAPKGPSSTDTSGGTSTGAAGTGAGTDEDQAKPGTNPGGPVGNVVDGQLGDLGMGAGGNFVGRSPQATVAAANAGATPYIDPKVFQEPAIQRLTQELKQRGQRDAESGDLPPATKGPGGMGTPTAQGRAASNERFLRGVALLNQRLGQGAAQPGAGPGGPVDAPQWPSDGSGSSQPSIQDAGSLGGGGSSFQTPTTTPSTPDTSGGAGGADSLGLGGMGGIGSVDPLTQQYALNQAAQVAQGGVGALGPQDLEEMSKTQRGTFEGALQALGLNPDDFNQAYSQTRFANLGNVLQA